MSEVDDLIGEHRARCMKEAKKMSDYEEMLAVFKAGFRARFDAPGLLKPEGDEAIRAGIRAVVDAKEARVEELRAALKPFAGIKADDGDDFSAYDDQVVIRCEVTVGDLKKARSALEAKP